MSEAEALQAALAGEHACVFGYGVVGAAVDADREPAARDAYDGHRLRRDEITDLLRRRGEEPVAALAGSALPFPVTGPAEAGELAALLEARLAVALAGLVREAGSAALRERSARWLAETAVRGAGWSGSVTGLPGLDPSP